MIGRGGERAFAACDEAVRRIEGSGAIAFRCVAGLPIAPAVANQARCALPFTNRRLPATSAPSCGWAPSGTQRLVLFPTSASRSLYDFPFTPDDVLLFGKESAGVPAAIADACPARVRIPMRPQVRSMNLASSVAIALGEALRQTGTLPG